MTQTQQPQHAPEKKGITKKQVRLILLLLVASVAGILIAQNTHKVPIKLWIWETTSSLIVLMLISMVLGAIIAIVIASVRSSRKKKEAGNLLNEVKKLRDALKKTNQRLNQKA